MLIHSVLNWNSTGTKATLAHREILLGTSENNIPTRNGNGGDLTSATGASIGLKLGFQSIVCTEMKTFQGGM